jgi:lambda family phage portal protein
MAILDAYGLPYIRTYYDSAGYGPRFRDFGNDSSSPTTTVEGELRILRSRSRQLVRNDAWTAGALESYVDDVIASGIDPEPRFPRALVDMLGGSQAAADKASEIREAWDIWGAECDAHEMADIYGIQAQVVRTVCESGECFVRFRVRRAEDGLYIPLQVQVLEPDYVPVEVIEPPARGGSIRGGVEFDRIGRRLGYWMYQEHPGEMRRSPGAEPNTPVFVPASEVIHIAELSRPGQIRFVPKTAPTIKRIMDLAVSNEANLMLQTVAAMFGGVIEEEEQELPPYDPTQSGVAGEGEADDRGQAEIDIVPGTLRYMPQGYRAKFTSPPDIGSNFIPYHQFHLQAISRNWGLPYHSVSGDMTGASFASLRADQNKMKRHILRVLGGYVHQFCEGVYARFIREGVLAGVLDLEDYATIPRFWHMATWNHTGWESTNPLQDANAEAVYLKNRTTSRRRIVAEKGGNFRDITQENAEDEQMMRDQGLAFGEAPAMSNQVGPFSDEPATEDEDDE